MKKLPKAIDSLTKNVEKVCFLISEASGVVNIFLSQLCQRNLTLWESTHPNINTTQLCLLESLTPASMARLFD